MTISLQAVLDGQVPEVDVYSVQRVTSEQHREDGA